METQHEYQLGFEKLDVWQNARLLAKDIYKITKTLPKEERYALSDQIRRSSISVSSNIAEGSARHTGKDQANFTTKAYSSLMELTNQLILASDLGYIKYECYQNIRSSINIIAKQLNALRNYQKKH